MYYVQLPKKKKNSINVKHEHTREPARLTQVHAGELAPMPREVTKEVMAVEEARERSTGRAEELVRAAIAVADGELLVDAPRAMPAPMSCLKPAIATLRLMHPCRPRGYPSSMVLFIV